MNVLKFKSLDEIDEQSYQKTENNNFPVWGTPQNLDNSNYLQEYLKSVLSRFVKVDFLIGNETIISKEGILKEVGTDYIVLEMLQTNDLTVCDLYSIKFVDII